MHNTLSGNLTSLLRQILNRPGLYPRPDLSLTLDLGFDSLQLMQFFAGVEQLYPRVRLEEWFLGQSQEGQDTIASLEAFIGKRFTAPEALAA